MRNRFNRDSNLQQEVTLAQIFPLHLHLDSQTDLRIAILRSLREYGPGFQPTAIVKLLIINLISGLIN
jgi:hypothetical protein